ncbi:MAG: hypothetical protein CL521_00490 [Actinobacteria bacterium]|nr:hypothetical protein [Actinomycetota bacterium]|tara:strand:- start:802 stop:1533 length:732 start_codon:yes stop_codon:yes gene_type:complete
MAYTDYNEITDRGIKDNVFAMRAFQVHYTNFMFYTINVATPGFIEEGTYNTRRKGTRRIDFVPFYRWRSGPVVETNRPLDFYLDASSRGFFVIKFPTTFVYTRDGRFRLDSRNRLVTMSGHYPVMGEGGEIFLPEGSVSVARSGMIFVDGEPVDRIKVAVFKSFKDMQNMETLNGSFFILTKPIDTLEGQEHYGVVQGYLEENNVLKAITGDILFAKNSFDVNAKSAQMLNRALSTSASFIAP